MFLDVTGCTSLPNPALPDGRLWKSGAVDLLRGVLAALWGSPSYRRGCRFPSSIPSQVPTPSDTQESFFGSICCQLEKRSSARTGWTQLVQEVSAQCLPSPHELLNQIPRAKPEFPPNADCSARTGLGCALCSWLAPGQALLGLGLQEPQPSVPITTRLRTSMCASHVLVSQSKKSGNQARFKSYLKKNNKPLAGEAG